MISRHLRALLSVCGRCLWGFEVLFLSCVCLGCCSLSVCVCVCVCVTCWSFYETHLEREDFRRFETQPRAGGSLQRDACVVLPQPAAHALAQFMLPVLDPALRKIHRIVKNKYLDPYTKSKIYSSTHIYTIQHTDRKRIHMCIVRASGACVRSVRVLCPWSDPEQIVEYIYLDPPI